VVSSNASSLGTAVDALDKDLSIGVTSNVVVLAVVGNLWMSLGGTCRTRLYVNLRLDRFILRLAAVTVTQSLYLFGVEKMMRPRNVIRAGFVKIRHQV